MTPLVDILDERHRRRLVNLKVCGRKFEFVVRTLGGVREGDELSPAQLETGLRRVAEFSGRTVTPAMLDAAPGWLRLARVIGYFTNLLAPFIRKPARLSFNR